MCVGKAPGLFPFSGVRCPRIAFVSVEWMLQTGRLIAVCRSGRTLRVPWHDRYNPLYPEQVAAMEVRGAFADKINGLRL